MDQWLEIRKLETLQGKSAKTDHSYSIPIPEWYSKLMDNQDSNKRHELMSNWVNIMEDKLWKKIWQYLVEETPPAVYPVWKLPHYRSKEVVAIPKITRSNRYLAHMQKSILAMIKNKEYRKAWLYGDILLRRSSAFLAWSYIKADKGWFLKFSEDKNK